MDTFDPSSKLIYSIFLFLLEFFIYSTASADFILSLAPIITEQFCLANQIAVYFPIPVFPPVTIATCPVKSRLTLQTPPLKYLLIEYKESIPAAPYKYNDFINKYFLIFILKKSQYKKLDLQKHKKSIIINNQMKSQNSKIKQLEDQLLVMTDLYELLKKNPKNKVKADSCYQNILQLKNKIQNLKNEKSVKSNKSIPEQPNLEKLELEFSKQSKIYNIEKLQDLHQKIQNCKAQIKDIEKNPKSKSASKLQQLKKNLKQYERILQISKLITTTKKNIKTNMKIMVNRKKQLQNKLKEMDIKDIKQGRAQITLLQQSCKRFESNPKFFRQVQSLKQQVAQLRQIISEIQLIDTKLSVQTKQQRNKRKLEMFKAELESKLKSRKINSIRQLRIIINALQKSIAYFEKKQDNQELTNELKIELQYLKGLFLLEHKVQKYKRKIFGQKNQKKQINELRKLIQKYLTQLSVKTIKQAREQCENLKKTLKTINKQKKPALYEQIETQIKNFQRVVEVDNQINGLEKQFGINQFKTLKQQYDQLSSNLSKIPHIEKLDEEIQKLEEGLKFYKKKQAEQKQYKNQLKTLKELKDQVNRMTELEISIQNTLQDDQQSQKFSKDTEQSSQEEAQQINQFFIQHFQSNNTPKSDNNNNHQFSFHKSVSSGSSQKYSEKYSQKYSEKQQEKLQPGKSNIFVKVCHLDKQIQMEIQPNQSLKSLIQKSNNMLNIQSSPQKMKLVDQNDEIVDQNKTISEALIPNSSKLRLTKPTNKFQILPHKVQLIKDQVMNSMNEYELEGDHYQNFSKQVQDDPKKIGILATKVLYQVSQNTEYVINSFPVQIQVQGKMTQILPNGKKISFNGQKNLIQIKYDVGNKITKQIKQQKKHFNRKNMNPQIIEQAKKLKQRQIGSTETKTVNQYIYDKDAQSKINNIYESINKKEKSKLYQYNKMAFYYGNANDLKYDHKLTQKAQQTLKKIGIFSKLNPNQVNRKFKTNRKCEIIYPSRKIQSKFVNDQLFQIRSQHGKPYYFINPQLLPVYMQNQMPRYLKQRLQYQHKQMLIRRLQLKNNDYDARYLLYSPEAIKGKKVCIVEYYKQDHQYFHMNVLKQAGFIVQYHTRFNRSMLKQDYDLIWVISSGTNRLFKQGELNFYIQAYQRGVGLFLWGDNQPYFFEANAILNQLFKGFQLTGNYYGTNTLIVSTDIKNGNFDANHPVSAGFVRLYEGNTICYPNGTHPQINVFAYNTEKKKLQPSLLYRNRKQNEGNIWIDSGFTKLYPSCHELYKQQVKRYIINVSSYIAKKRKI